MLTHNELKQKMLSSSEVRVAYDDLEDEFSVFDELLRARMSAGLTQTEVAEIMGTKTPAIARLESGGGRKQHSPSLSTLRKYAEAVGCHVEIKLVQNSNNAQHL